MPGKRKTYATKKTNLVSFWIMFSLFVGTILGYEFSNNIDTSNEFVKSHVILPENIELCFTPPSGCASVIVKEISNAKESIYVQAYGMTSPVIVESLVKAKEKGLKVRILLDKSNLKDKWSKIRELQDSGIDVGIDRVSGIAHNKVMIIDRVKVITGSFNFTRSADNRNAENVIIINNELVAKQYLNNWFSRNAKINDQIKKKRGVK